LPAANGSMARACLRRTVRRFEGSGFASFPRPRNGSRAGALSSLRKVRRCVDRGSPRCADLRRRSLRRACSRRNARRCGSGACARFGPTEGEGGNLGFRRNPGTRRTRASALVRTGLFEARRRAQAGPHASETGFGHPGLGLARVPQGTAQVLAAWTGPAGTGDGVRAAPRCPPTQRVMALPRHGRS